MICDGTQVQVLIGVRGPGADQALARVLKELSKE